MQGASAEEWSPGGTETAGTTELGRGIWLQTPPDLCPAACLATPPLHHCTATSSSY